MKELRDTWTSILQRNWQFQEARGRRLLSLKEWMKQNWEQNEQNNPGFSLRFVMEFSI